MVMKKVAFDVNSVVKNLKTGGWRPLVVGLLGLLALWMAWQGFKVFREQGLQDSVDVKRSQVAQQINPVVKKAVDQLEAARERATLIAALKKNDKKAAQAILSEAWPEAQQIEFFSPDLNTAYKHPAAFGFGKLSVIENALDRKATYFSVAAEKGAPGISMAAPVIDESGQMIQVISLRLPLKALSDAVMNADMPGTTYLSLRQGRYDVAEKGNLEIRNKPDVGAIDVPNSDLKVLALSPNAELGIGEMKGKGEFGIALLFLLGALAAHFIRPKYEPVIGEEVFRRAEQPTLAQLQASGEILPPEDSRPLIVVSERTKRAEPTNIAVNRTIFRAYDIRGVVGQTLDESIAKLIGHAIGSLMQEKNQRSVVVGRDGRLSSPQLTAALIEGLQMAGREVIDVGLVPTPIVYFGTFFLRTGTGISVTGSHNPPDYNGFKIVVDGETLSGDAIQDLYARITEGRLHHSDSVGNVSVRDIQDDYIQRVSGDIQIERKLKVVIDCGSGAAGELAPKLLEAIGAEVEPLFCEIDGTFPHHHPDPSDPETLKSLIEAVQRTGADIGLALDGDGDRLGVVTPSGEMVYADKLLMLFAGDVLERNPGACIIYDVKCTNLLPGHILRYGGSPLMWKTGHSLIKAKMKETEAELAGEMSGHFFFRERWYGFDDGLYAGARLLEILAASPDDANALFAGMPENLSTPEMKIAVGEGEQYEFIEKFLQNAKFDGARISTIDGLRADWPDGWGLVRASNTTPMLVLRFEAKNNEALQRISELFRTQMKAIDPNMALPF
jgi:phosphomannomutase / phosphoglucomutase